MNDTEPLALVTGASSGIGFELARQLAERGYDLVVNAEDDTPLQQAVQRLRTAGARVEAVRADLRDPEQTERLFAAATALGRPLDVVALNAGVGQGGAFVDTDLADELEIIDLNVRSTVHLAKLVLRDMAARDEGRVLVTSSIASTTPGPFQAVYNASKSFLQSFTEALRNEFEDTGVTLTSLMPGPTETAFFHRADMDDTKIGRQDKDDPAQVARQGLDALFAGKGKVVAGSVRTKAQAVAGKVLPDSLKAEAHRRVAEPGSGDEG
ncbi:oxidoreductase [Streptomyces litmocidini]|uniref:SDR family NAD(P)-dependent oxidoreductase n=1 Tax=Streptomyces litmocidini TaxID=67318 RepID=UPI00167E02D9|nr:SDR family NAD(P)-dependent oxidoreductase [Streptomyces litmocidini]GGU83282.1 oxidoreductase [Streptomyces litmocidini]